MWSSPLRIITRHWRLKPLLVQTPIRPFPEKDVDVVAISSEKQIESPEESNILVEESFCEKSPLAPPESEVVEEVEKEAHYVVPTPYNPPNVRKLSIYSVTSA